MGTTTAIATATASFYLTNRNYVGLQGSFDNCYIKDTQRWSYYYYSTSPSDPPIIDVEAYWATYIDNDELTSPERGVNKWSILTQNSGSSGNIDEYAIGPSSGIRLLSLNNNKTIYYFWVAAASSLDDSNYQKTIYNEAFDKNFVLSDRIQYMTPPIIESGAPITKTNMDDLRSYKIFNQLGTPTAVTQGNSITATIGNEYKANSASTGTVITADWYNNA